MNRSYRNKLNKNLQRPTIQRSQRILKDDRDAAARREDNWIFPCEQLFRRQWLRIARCTSWGIRREPSRLRWRRRSKSLRIQFDGCRVHTKRKPETKFIVNPWTISNYIKISYLGEIGSDESLLHADENCQRNQKLLIWFLELFEGSRKQLHSRQLLCWDRSSSPFTISRKWIHEQADNDDSRQNTSQVNRRDLEDFRVWRSFQVGIVRRSDHAEVCTAEIQGRIGLIARVAATLSMCTRR